MRGCYRLGVVALGQQRGNLDSHGAIMGVMHDGNERLLSAVRLYGMGVTLRKALDMYESSHLSISYLLRDEEGDLEHKSQVWIGDIRG